MHSRHPVDELFELRRDRRADAAREKELVEIILKSGDLTGDVAVARVVPIRARTKQVTRRAARVLRIRRKQ
jgi:hypothetical protein